MALKTLDASQPDTGWLQRDWGYGNVDFVLLTAGVASRYRPCLCKIIGIVSRLAVFEMSYRTEGGGWSSVFHKGASAVVLYPTFPFRGSTTPPNRVHGMYYMYTFIIKVPLNLNLFVVL